MQGEVKHPLERLRHIGCWLDICEAYQSEHGDKRLDDSLFDVLKQEYDTKPIPEEANPTEITPKILFEICCEETNSPTIKDIIDLIKSLQTDDMARLLNVRQSEGQQAQSRLIVSTIHKVKGLEFDRVVILSSQYKFPFTENDNLQLAAAEEARLWYVAMTRAKTHLVSIRAEREVAWFKCQQFVECQQDSQIYLQGDYEEFVMSWSAYNNSVAIKGYELLLHNIKVGDILNLQGKYQLNRKGITEFVRFVRTDKNMRVGKLSEDVALRMENESSYNNLRVMAVIRYPLDLESDDAPLFRDDVKAQGWTYLVLAAG